jgi:hypothetical protein
MRRFAAKPPQMIILVFLKPYTSVKTSPKIYVMGKRITAEGSTTPYTEINLPAITFETSRVVKKRANNSKNKGEKDTSSFFIDRASCFV